MRRGHVGGLIVLAVLAVLVSGLYLLAHLLILAGVAVMVAGAYGLGRHDGSRPRGRVVR